MGGGKNQTSTSSVSIPPEVLARYNSVNARAENVAQQPFTPYNGQFVAGLTGTQQAGIQNTNALAGAAQPYINAGAGLTLGSAADLQPTQYNGSEINKYMSPYIQNVYDATSANIDRQNATQQQAMKGDQIKQNAFGGDRAGIASAELTRSQNLAGQQTLAGILQQGFTGAQSEFNNQQAIDLGADQNTAARMAAAGNSIGALGVQGQQAGLAGAAAQMQAGQVEQGTQQADLTAQYNQFLQGKSYPFQVAQFLANIAMGTGALTGSTTTSTSPAPFFSDARMKENAIPVGKTFDGQPIYRFNYKGDNRTQIGLMAQDVEHAHPDAVGEDSGFLTVDYDKATRRAAERGLGAAAPHKASGGGLGNIDPYSPRGGQSPYPTPGSYVPQAILPVPGLVTAKTSEAKSSTGLADAAKTASSLAGLYKDGKSIYDDWNKPSKAEGGEVDAPDPDYPDSEPVKAPDVHTYVPKADLPVAGLKTADTKGGSGGSGGLGDVASLMSSAAKIIPFFMAHNGGAIGHYAGGGYADMDPDEMAIRTLVRETGRNEPDEGVAAVAHVFQNRVNAGGYGNGLSGVITKPRQFEPWNSAGTGNGADPLTVDMSGPDAQRAAAIWQKVKAGEIPDPTGGAVNFANRDVVHQRGITRGNAWVDSMQNPVVIGHHTFGTAGGAPGRDGVRTVADKSPTPPRVIDAPPQARSYSPGLASAAPDDGGSPVSRGFSAITDKVGGMSDNSKLSLLAGLFGMLSSKSHWLLPAIGEGGLAAIGTYKDLEKQKADIEYTNAAASSTRVDALSKSIIKDADGYPVGVWTSKGYMSYGDWQKNPVAPAGYIPSGDVVAGILKSQGVKRPDTYGQTRDLGANGQPETRALGQRPVTPPAPRAGEAAKPNQPLTAPAPAAVETQELPPPVASDTQPVRPVPPVAPPDLHPDLAAAAADEYAHAGNPADHIARTAAKKLKDETNDQAEVNRQARPIMNDLAKSIAMAPESGPLVQGTGAGSRYAIAAAMNAVTRFAGLGDMFENGTTISQEAINQKIGTLTAAANKGDMKAVYALEMFKHTVPSLDMMPDAAATMVSEMYRQRQRAIDRANQFNGYVTTSQGRAANFDTKFDATHKGYDNEAHIIKDMIMQRDSRNGRTLLDEYLNHDPSASDVFMAKRYGTATWANMKRYFQ